jgi:hypothetical protein
MSEIISPTFWSYSGTHPVNEKCRFTPMRFTRSSALRVLAGTGSTRLSALRGAVTNGTPSAPAAASRNFRRVIKRSTFPSSSSLSEAAGLTDVEQVGHFSLIFRLAPRLFLVVRAVIYWWNLRPYHVADLIRLQRSKGILSGPKACRYWMVCHLFPPFSLVGRSEVLSHGVPV